MLSAAELPDDVEALKAMLRRQQADHEAQTRQHQAEHGAQKRQLEAEYNTQHRQLRDDYEQQLSGLREQLNLLLAKRFGTSSEQHSPDQLRLFCEPVDEIEPASFNEDSTEVPAHRRAKRGRRPLPQNLPRVDVVHDFSDEEKVCPTDGTALEVIGEDSSEQLDIVPAEVQVIRYIRRKYACPCCEQQVTTAPLPPQPIPRSNASPGMLAGACCHLKVRRCLTPVPAGSHLPAPWG